MPPDELQSLAASHRATALASLKRLAVEGKTEAVREAARKALIRAEVTTIAGIPIAILIGRSAIGSCPGLQYVLRAHEE